MPQQTIASPFGHGSTALEVVADVDLTGKTAIVTGAASGIGVETARALAQAGAAVWMPVRNVVKGEAEAAHIRASTGNPHVYVALMDLIDPDSVRAFAQTFLATDAPLQILINNAGIMACPLARSAAGWESQFATNHMGHFLLTCLLVPALRHGAPARAVNLSSTGHKLSQVHFADPHFNSRPYDKWQAYGQAKTANVLFTVALDKRLRDHGVRAFAVHPGGIMTGLQKDLTFDEMNAMGWFDENGNPREGFKTVAGGAATAIWAATSPLLDGRGGEYLEDCNVAKMAAEGERISGVNAHALDAEAAERLWTLSEEMLDERFSFH
jgi:NAD(P)-dependent dehydrogenase (short-subunit alcohol dehydrogenase family)